MGFPKRYIFFIGILLVVACSKNEQNLSISPSELLIVPSHFPEVDFPEDNPFSEESWELGKMLFFDTALSVNNSISCASCHKTQNAFADNTPFSNGVNERAGTRNVPTLANVAFHPYYTREGGVPSLEMQVFVPIQEHNEFDFNIIEIVERLSSNNLYQELSQQAYGRNLDAFVLVRALANFERTLISANSKYDQFLQGKTVLSQAETQGKHLFFSDSLACASCHAGFDFSNYEFANNGLYQEYEDTGRFRLTNDSVDLALFKIPSLRNIEKTAPYMHDGSLETLEQVIEHYENGVQTHQNLSSNLGNFTLSEQEKTNLIAFLNTLTDHNFIENPIYINDEK